MAFVEFRAAVRGACMCALGSVVALGCGGGGDAVGADGLSGGDVNDMVGAFRAMGSFTAELSLTSAQPTSPDLAAQMRVTQINRDVPCAAGGLVHLGGTFETYFSGTQSAYVANVTQQHVACQTVEKNSRQWTFDGAPEVTLHTEYVINSNTHIVRMIGTYKGSFTWTNSSGASGTCSVDFKLSENGVPATKNAPAIGVTGQITGMMCTRKIDIHY